MDVFDEVGVKWGLKCHPAEIAYDIYTAEKTLEAIGHREAFGFNFDPSHFFWQGIEPIESVKALGGKAIFHVHAKDSKVDPVNGAINGVLDTKHYGDEANRSWLFRTCGYGHGMEWWKAFFSALRLVGYDGPVSIEHEDSLMSSQEGLTKAVEFLKQCIIREKPGAMHWA